MAARCAMALRHAACASLAPNSLRADGKQHASWVSSCCLASPRPNGSVVLRPGDGPDQGTGRAFRSTDGKDHSIAHPTLPPLPAPKTCLGVKTTRPMPMRAAHGANRCALALARR